MSFTNQNKLHFNVCTYIRKLYLFNFVLVWCSLFPRKKYNMVAPNGCNMMSTVYFLALSWQELYYSSHAVTAQNIKSTHS